jgi:hypothetical protein
VRSSPFNRPAATNAASGTGGLALSLPHQAPAPGAPTSISQPGGWARVLTSLGIIGGSAFAGESERASDYERGEAQRALCEASSC